MAWRRAFHLRRSLLGERWQRRALARLLRRERRKLWRVRLADAFAEERVALKPRFLAWDVDESRRIRAERAEDLSILFRTPGEVRAHVAERFVRAKQLPIVSHGSPFDRDFGGDGPAGQNPGASSTSPPERTAEGGP